MLLQLFIDNERNYEISDHFFTYSYLIAQEKMFKIDQNQAMVCKFQNIFYLGEGGEKGEKNRI